MDPVAVGGMVVFCFSYRMALFLCPNSARELSGWLAPLWSELRHVDRYCATVSQLSTSLLKLFRFAFRLSMLAYIGHQWIFFLKLVHCEKLFEETVIVHAHNVTDPAQFVFGEEGVDARHIGADEDLGVCFSFPAI
jgi:hypothetical protein